MKRLTLPFFFLFASLITASCGAGKMAGYRLTEADAAAAIRQMLRFGAEGADFTAAFAKENILRTIFPEGVVKILNTANTLGLTSEVDRFTTTLSTAATQTTTTSIPIFAASISNMRLRDAMSLIKGGGTSATDHLRTTVGDSLRRAIRPIMQSALSEYKLIEEWNKITEPLSGIGGGRLKLDLPTLMSVAVSEAMFRKMAEEERKIREDANNRKTELLRKVFSRDWNNS